MSSYPEAPEGWTPVACRAVGPFTTHLTFGRHDGGTTVWSSRAHRKHASRFSRASPGQERVWWAPQRASWWIGFLFAVGSSCFLVAPFPGFVELVGSGVDGMVFFVGSVFFTSAAALQCLETFNADREPGGGGHRRRLRLLAFEPRRIDWWSSVLQLVGTLLFNRDTFRAMQTGLEQPGYDQLVWRPDALGSACFLVSGYLAYVEVCGGLACRPRRRLEWRIAAVNLAGCVAFGLSAVAAYVIPATGGVVALVAANAFTALGALCFLVGAVLLLPESATAASS
jgi:YrhK-like protein